MGRKQTEADRKYTAAHRDLYRDAAKRWRIRNRAKLNIAAKIRYWRNPEAARLARKRWAAKYPDRAHASAKAARAKSRENGWIRGYRVKQKAWYVDYKSRTPCFDCHLCFNPECMDFDHIVAGEKTNQVSWLVSYGRERAEQEMEKCQLVCATCHRIRTAKRRVLKLTAITPRSRDSSRSLVPAELDYSI